MKQWYGHTLKDRLKSKICAPPLQMFLFMLPGVSNEVGHWLAKQGVDRVSTSLGPSFVVGWIFVVWLYLIILEVVLCLYCIHLLSCILLLSRETVMRTKEKRWRFKSLKKSSRIRTLWIVRATENLITNKVKWRSRNKKKNRSTNMIMMMMLIMIGSICMTLILMVFSIYRCEHEWFIFSSMVWIF